MKRFIKIISALLAVLMLMGTLTVAASASIPLLPYEGDDKDYDRDEIAHDREDLTYDVDWEDTINVYLGETDKLNNKDNADKQFVYNTPQEKLASMKMMSESHGYQLWVDDVTGEVATVKTSTGEILFSNPWNTQDASYENGENKRTTALTVKKQLLSQIIVNYVDNDTDKLMYSCIEAAARGQISVDYISNGVRVEYSIGREETRMLLPMLIRKERFELKILKPLRETINEQVRQTFTEYDKTRYPDAPYEVGEEIGFYDMFQLRYPDFDISGENDYINYPGEHKLLMDVAAYYYEKNLDDAKSDREAASILAAYPITKKMAVYVFDPAATDLEKARVERKIKDLVPTYTYEDLDKDHEETEYVGVEKTPPLFKMALEYTLDENGMSVRLPASGIRFDQSLYQLNNIEMLPYMGAGANDGDFEDGGDGYTFFPDGSGALFDFQQLNTGRNTTINGKIYGNDYAYHELTGTYQETIRYPAFGIVEKSETPKTVVDYDNVIKEAVYDSNGKLLTPAEYGTKIETVNQDRGFLAIIEEGDALAELSTFHMSSTSIYNTVRMIFYPRPKDSYNMADALSVGSNAKMTVVSDRKYVGNYQVRYIMLSDDAVAAENKLSSYYEASWMGMAVAYRDYLEANSVLDRLTEADVDDDIPLYIETFGALWTTEKILSIPVDVMTPLTSFEDVKTMYTELSSAIESSMAELITEKENNATSESSAKNFSNLNFKLTGYANGGMYSTVPYNLNWEAAVGGASGFQELVDFSRKEGFDLFPDFDFVYINTEEVLDGVSLFTDAIKTIDNRYTGRRLYSATTQSYQGYFGLAIAPSCFEKFITKLAVNYLKYNPTGISVSTLGSDLNSDFNEDDPLNREDSKGYTIEAFKQLSMLRTEGDEALQIMTEGGNAYTWRYVDHILNMPLNSSRYNISSNAVPFLGVVLHGYVQFAGTPINEEGDIEYAFLKALENGANLYFTLSYQNTQKLKEYTDLSEYFSVRYDIWKDDVVDMYVELNDLLCDLQTKLIIDHEFLVGDRVPDDAEHLEDIENNQQAEDLKEAAETIEQIKQELKDALALRHTPNESVDTIEAALKEAGEQVKTLAKHIGMIEGDADYVNYCVGLIRAVKSAEKSVEAAKKAEFSSDAGDAAIAAVKSYINDKLIVEGIASSNKLIADLNEADKVKATELQGKLINTALTVASVRATNLAIEELGKLYSSTAEENEVVVADVAKLINDVEAAMKAVDSKGLDNISAAVIRDVKAVLASGVATESFATAKKAYNDSIKALEAKFNTAVDSGVALQTLVNKASATIEAAKLQNAILLYTDLKETESKLNAANAIKNGFSGKVSAAYDTPINDVYKKLTALVSSDDYKDASGNAVAKNVKDALINTIFELEKNKQLLALYSALNDEAFAANVATLTKNVQDYTAKYNALDAQVKASADTAWNELMAEMNSVRSDAAARYEELVNKINEVCDANEAIYREYARDDIKDAVSIVNDAGRYLLIQNAAKQYDAADDSFAADIALAEAVTANAAATEAVNALDADVKTRANRVITRCKDLILNVQGSVDANLGKLYIDAAASMVKAETLENEFAPEIVTYMSEVASIAGLEADKIAAKAALDQNEQVALDKIAADASFDEKKTAFEEKAGSGKAAQITNIVDAINKAEISRDSAKASYDFAKALYNPTGDTTEAWRKNCTEDELKDYDLRKELYNTAEEALNVEKAKLQEAEKANASCIDELNALIAAYEAMTLATDNLNSISAIGDEIAKVVAAQSAIDFENSSSKLQNAYYEAVDATVKRNELNAAIAGNDSYKTSIKAAATAFADIESRYELSKNALAAAEKAKAELLARVTTTSNDKVAAEWIASIYEIAATVAANTVAELKLLMNDSQDKTAKRLYERAYIVASTDIEVLKKNAAESSDERSEAKLLYAAAEANAKHSRKGIAELNESYQRKFITAQREMSNAQQFYDAAVVETAKAQAAFDEIKALYEDSKQSYEGLVALQVNVLLFGDDAIATLKEAAIADVKKVNDLYASVSASISLIVEEWGKLETAAAEYKSVKAVYDVLASADMLSMTAEQKAQNRTDRIYYAYKLKVAEDQINASKNAIETEFADKFNGDFTEIDKIIGYVAKHEAEAKTQFELAETLYKSVRGNASISDDVKRDAKTAYDSAKALYQFIKTNNAKFTVAEGESVSEFRALCDKIFEYGVLVPIDETAENIEYMTPVEYTKVTDYVNEVFGIESENDASEDNEEKKDNKYLCDDGSIVAVTYGGKGGKDTVAYRTFILNFNSFKVTVNYGGIEYTVDAYGYKVIDHNKEGEAA